MTTPPLPSLRALTAELRALHAAWSHPDAGGEYVVLVCEQQCLGEPPQWRVVSVGMVSSLCLAYDRVFRPMAYGREYVPGSTERECTACKDQYPYHQARCPVCDGSGKTSVPSPFDATAAARRLLAAARDGGCK
jgi:hypothetical protein